MDIRIGSRNIKITDGLEEYVHRKMDKLDRYLPGIQELRVDLARQNNSRGEDMSIAQITVHHSRGAILRAEEKTTGEIHHAIDNATDKMYRQIKRFKGKRIDNKRRNKRFMATLEELELAEELPISDSNGDTLVEVEDGRTEVIRRKNVVLTPMDEVEAIEQMELLGHNFFMFYNAETGLINVLYRRTEDGYGLLEPLNE